MADQTQAVQTTSTGEKATTTGEISAEESISAEPASTVEEQTTPSAQHNDGVMPISAEATPAEVPAAFANNMPIDQNAKLAFSGPHNNFKFRARPFDPRFEATGRDRRRKFRPQPGLECTNTVTPMMHVGVGPNPGTLPYPVSRADITAITFPITSFPFMTPDQDLAYRKQLILYQVDYYFSVENLCRDIYLRKHMDNNGWVPISLIGSFNRIRALTDKDSIIRDAIKLSRVVEVKGMKVRKRLNYAFWVLKKEDAQPTLTTQSTATSKLESEAVLHTPPATAPSALHSETQKGGPSYSHVLLTKSSPSQSAPISGNKEESSNDARKTKKQTKGEEAVTPTHDTSRANTPPTKQKQKPPLRLATKATRDPLPNDEHTASPTSSQNANNDSHQPTNVTKPDTKDTNFNLRAECLRDNEHPSPFSNKSKKSAGQAKHRNETARSAVHQTQAQTTEQSQQTPEHPQHQKTSEQAQHQQQPATQPEPELGRPQLEATSDQTGAVAVGEPAACDANEKSSVPPAKARPKKDQRAPKQKAKSQPVQQTPPQSQPPQSQPPQSQPSQSQLPQSQPPQSQLPQSQPPQSQLPQSQLPQSQPPQSQSQSQQPQSSLQTRQRVAQPKPETRNSQPKPSTPSTQSAPKSQQPFNHVSVHEEDLSIPLQMLSILQRPVLPLLVDTTHSTPRAALKAKKSWKNRIVVWHGVAFLAVVLVLLSLYIRNFTDLVDSLKP